MTRFSKFEIVQEIDSDFFQMFKKHEGKILKFTFNSYSQAKIKKNKYEKEAKNSGFNYKIIQKGRFLFFDLRKKKISKLKKATIISKIRKVLRKNPEGLPVKKIAKLIKLPTRQISDLIWQNKHHQREVEYVNKVWRLKKL